ncbi:MAG: DUF1488 domain-containing protein, partial [Pseudomonas sp.]
PNQTRSSRLKSTIPVWSRAFSRLTSPDGRWWFALVALYKKRVVEEKPSRCASIVGRMIVGDATTFVPAQAGMEQPARPARGKGETMAIHFSNTPGLYTQNTTVAFRAQLNGVDVTCEISTEALQDHFSARSARGADLVAAFDANRPVIEAVAREKLPQRIPAGRCLLVSADF